MGPWKRQPAQAHGAGVGRKAKRRPGCHTHALAAARPSRLSLPCPRRRSFPPRRRRRLQAAAAPAPWVVPPRISASSPLNQVRLGKCPSSGRGSWQNPDFLVRACGCGAGGQGRGGVVAGGSRSWIAYSSMPRGNPLVRSSLPACE